MFLYQKKIRTLINQIRVINIFFIILLIIGFKNIYAQESITNAFKNEVTKANAFYNDHYYQEALKLYLNAHKLDPRNDIKAKIADCYVKINEPDKACKWFGILIENNYPLSSKEVLSYVLALTGNADYKNAEIWYEKYLLMINDTSQNSLNITKRDIALFYKDSSQYDIREIEENTMQSEFSPIFYEKGIAFISSRKDQLFIKNNLPQSDNGFFNIFYAPFDKIEKGEVPIPVIGNPKLIQGQFPKNIHKGPFAITNKSMYVTLNQNITPSNKEDITERKLSIFELKKKGKKWVNAKLLSFNNKDYSCGHPTVSSDGKTMYFISDMEGGFGGTDLYKSNLVKGKWAKPIRLGTKINTIGNEMFPYLHNDTTLYFASNGHPGLGGLDIYKISLLDSNATAINVGYPINSKNDDFGIVLNENGYIGFFSSNRKNGKNDDDIYKVIINIGKPGPLYTKLVSGSINMYKSQYQQENPSIVSSADIIVIDFESLDPIAQTQTDENGNFQLEVPYSGKFFLMCNKKNAGSYQTTFSIPEKTSFKENFFIVFFKDDLFENE